MEQKDEFLTITDTPAEGFYSEKRSKFLAFAFHVTSEEEVKQYVAEFRKKYYDARHVCWAYMLGAERTDFRANDDGEPSGSAGRPILGQIDSLGLSDVLVVVVRYFGGIKLGIPGLIRAYRSSTSDALSSARIITRTASRRFRLEYPYEAMNSVMKAVKELAMDSTPPAFGLECSLEVKVRLSLAGDFLLRCRDIVGCKVQEL